MKNIIFKKRWKKNTTINAFFELGLDKDNNKYFIGSSSEIEKSNGNEYRINGVIKMKIKEIYIRIWILKYCFSIGTGEMDLIKKDRNNFKILLGFAGFRKAGI